MRREKCFLIVLILILLPTLTYIFVHFFNIYENTTGSKIAQKKVEKYLYDKYPNHKLSVVSINYISKIHEYHCIVKDEDGLTYGATFDENSILTDTYIERKVEFELQNKLVPFINKIMGTNDEPYIQVEGITENNKNDEFNIRVNITLPEKEKIKTTKEFTEYVILVRDEFLKLLENNYEVNELCIRLNSFIVDFNNEQLNYNYNEIEKIIINNNNI